MSTGYEEIYIFRNEQHQQNAFEKQLNFYKQGELCDIILIVGNNRFEIHAHKIVLSGWSDYFLEKLKAKCKLYYESKDIDATALQSIVDFMYSGEIGLNLKNAESILRTAVFLKMTILVNGCCEFMEKNINSNNYMKYFSLSNELCLSELKDKCLKHIYYNFEEISRRGDLLQLKENELKFLLENANPQRDSNLEECIFCVIVDWIEYKNANRKDLASRLLSIVRYQLLRPDIILKKWNPCGKTQESCKIVYSWLRLLSNENQFSYSRNQPCDAGGQDSTFTFRTDDDRRKSHDNVRPCSSNSINNNDVPVTIFKFGYNAAVKAAAAAVAAQKQT